MSESRGDELALAEHNYETNGRQAATTKYVSRDLSRPGGAPATDARGPGDNSSGHANIRFVQVSSIMGKRY